jgi:HSP20 family protein
MTNIIKKANGRPATFGSVVDQLFHPNFDRLFDDRLWGFNGLTTSSTVPVNIRETDAAFELELVAPGLKKEDFHLNYSDHTLTVSFERRQEELKKESGTWIHREYLNQSFTRSFTIDDSIDTERASARYENGVLKLTLPKKEEAKQLSRTIQIQ